MNLHVVSYIYLGGVLLLTRPSWLLKGTPLSRAKAQSIREAVAITPMEAAAMRSMTMHVITVAPPLLFVAWRKISMKGNPVGVARASSMLPRQKRIAI